MKYEIIKNGQVVNTIEADESFVLAVYGKGNFRAVTEDVVPEPNPAPLARHITPLAFRRRFTKAERAAVEWAAVDKSDRPEAERQMAAALRADLKDQEQAKFIDLDDPDLIEGVATLEAYGLIAEGRATEILSAPVQAGERA